MNDLLYCQRNKVFGILPVCPCLIETSFAYAILKIQQANIIQIVYAAKNAATKIEKFFCIFAKKIDI